MIFSWPAGRREAQEFIKESTDNATDHMSSHNNLERRERKEDNNASENGLEQCTEDKDMDIFSNSNRIEN